MNYISENFLLHSPAAVELYHDHAKHMPIIDYHCHLPAREIAADMHWKNLTEIWLKGDHYKWRAMRSNGVEEELITGNADDRKKFDAYARTLPYLIRNPLYDWSHLELTRYFGINKTLSPDTADEIWETTCAMLASARFSARNIMTNSNVRLVCTTDDPTDNLEAHRIIAEDGFQVKVLPTWRPDKILHIQNTKIWNSYISKLAETTNIDICNFRRLIDAVQNRHNFFASHGCKLSDYGITSIPDTPSPTDAQMSAIFDKALSGEEPSREECNSFTFGMLLEFGRMDARADWTWQLHYGALRNASTRIFTALGPDAGADCIDDAPIARGLARLLDMLDMENLLPRTILYNLNPRDNALLGTMLGNFQRAPTPSKLQLGSGWWFNDHKNGMRDQLNAISNLGLLSRFVGMLTDSRSFLSYPRHEYFRRILCDIFGEEIENGDIPRDIDRIGQIVRDICFNNAKSYFAFTL